MGWELTRGSPKPCKQALWRQNKKCTKGVGSQEGYCTRTYAVFGPVKGHSQVDTPENATINQNNWKVLVCKATGKKWSNFTQTKSDMVERTCERLHKLKSRNIPLHYIRLDPSGKNHKLAKLAVSSNWAILQLLIFEFTSCDIPQHNSLAELAFPYLAGKVHAMMGGALMPEELHVKVTLEAIACTTQWDGLTVVNVNGTEATHDINMFGANPKCTANLQAMLQITAKLLSNYCLPSKLLSLGQ